MALPAPPGLRPSEIGFLCEMEPVTVIPRQRLDALPLLSGQTPSLRPPHRADLPLWLALLLKRQRRADIVPPRWLHPTVLGNILEREVNVSFPFSPSIPLASGSSNQGMVNLTPPFQPASTASHDISSTRDRMGAVTDRQDALPYHWLELSTLLLASAADDVPDAEAVRRLLRDLREVRLAKLRAMIQTLDPGGGTRLDGIGALEVGEGRAFLGGVVDSLRRLGAARETTHRERAEEDAEADEAARGGVAGSSGFADNDDNMMAF